MASATTYNIASNREDIMSGFTMLEPEKTPILSMAKKGTAPRASYSEWVVDTLDDVSLTPVSEGTDVTSFDNPGQDRARLGNYLTRKDKSWQVSDLEMLVDDAATDNQVATAKTKKLAEHKRDIESILGSDTEMSAGNPGAAATRGLGKWIQATAQATNPVPADFRPPAASIDATATSSLDEDDVNDVLESIYQVTGDVTNFKLFCGTALKRAFSNFTRVQPANSVLRVNTDASSKSLTLNVMRYEGDFGAVDLIPDLFLAKDSAAAVSNARGYLINPDLVQVAFADGPSHYELEDKGGGPRGFYKSWFTLRVKNPKGLGKFAASS